MNHPKHVYESPGGFPPKPFTRRTAFARWQDRRECRRAGGHWWHPDEGSMIAWFCCYCGAERDGMPRDGS